MSNKLFTIEPTIVVPNANAINQPPSVSIIGFSKNILIVSLSPFFMNNIIINTSKSLKLKLVTNFEYTPAG